jgi:hypothetical protein
LSTAPSALEFHHLEAVQRGLGPWLQPIAEFTIALLVLESIRDRFAEQGLVSPAGSPNFS